MRANQDIYHKIIVKDHVSKLLFALRHYDTTTYYHSCRTAKLAMELAFDRLGLNDMEVLAEAALLHDVGKIMIDKKILTKPGKLTKSEYGIMKQHASYGVAIAKSFGVHDNVLYLIGHHHPADNDNHLENNDPMLKALNKADVIDALVHSRPYKPPFSKKKVVELLYNRFQDDASNEEAIRIIW